MVYTVEQIKHITAPIAQAYGVKSLSLFGSYARGEATENSDIDLLVECEAIRSAFQMGGLYADLSEGLGKTLDLVTTNHRDKAFLGRIEADQLIAENPSISWKQIKGMRTWFAHQHWDMNYETVWVTLTEDIPDLKHRLEKIT